MVDKKPKQTMRYSDEEISLMKNTFADNEELLKAIRKVFLQIELRPEEQAMITGLSNHKNVLDLLHKVFLPELDGDAPFNQIIDLWMTVEVKGKTPQEAFLELSAREKLISYLEKQLVILSGGVTADISFSECTKLNLGVDQVYCNIIMRNTLIQHVEMQLHTILLLAGHKNESPEDTKKRLAKDSSK